jgi:hypothetical protein
MIGGCYQLYSRPAWKERGRPGVNTRVLDVTEALSAKRRSRAFITRPNTVKRELTAWLARRLRR